jgi:hypothetical protein
MGKKLRSGIRDEHPDLDHNSESLETLFGLKILKFFYADPESFDPGSGMEKFGSG